MDTLVQYVHDVLFLCNKMFVLTKICLSGSKDGSPEIIGPDKVQIKAQPGDKLWTAIMCLLIIMAYICLRGIIYLKTIYESAYIDAVWSAGELLVLHCAARTNCEDDVAITYWLVNGAFPEETRSHDRIIESEEWVLQT